MSSTPKRLLAATNAACAARSDDGGIDERVDILSAKGTLDLELAAELCEAAREFVDDGLGTVNVRNVFDKLLSNDEPSKMVGRVTIHIRKHNGPTTFYCFTEGGLNSLLTDDDALSRARQVLIADDFPAFRTEGGLFATWQKAEPEVTQPESLESIAPRSLVHDGPKSLVPTSVANLLLRDEPVAPSWVFEQWLAHSAKTLPYVLVDEIRSSVDGTVLVVSGPRRRLITFQNINMDPATVAAQAKVATWIYAESQDVETRLTLFRSELARTWPEGKTWQEGFLDAGLHALGSAKSAFGLYLSGITAEALAALGDLRKALTAEVDKVVEQTRALGLSMWRDFVVAAAAIVLRVVTTPNTDSLSNRFIAVGAAIFLAYSLLIALISNARFNAIGDGTRALWRDGYFGLIPSEEVDKLAGGPLEAVKKVYSDMAWWVALFYGAFIAVILCLAVWQTGWNDNIARSAVSIHTYLSHSAQPAPSPPKTKTKSVLVQMKPTKSPVTGPGHTP